MQARFKFARVLCLLLCFQLGMPLPFSTHQVWAGPTDPPATPIPATPVEEQSFSITNEIQIAFVPDLNRADQLARFLEERLTQAYRGLDQPHLAMEIVHVGGVAQFPQELSWLVNYLKHSFETDSRMPSPLDVKLTFVSKEKLNETLREQQRQLDSLTDRIASHYDAFNQVIEQLTQQLTELEVLSRQVDAHARQIVAQFGREEEKRDLAEFIAKLRYDATGIRNFINSFKGKTEENIWEGFNTTREALLGSADTLERVIEDFLAVEDQNDGGTKPFRQAIELLRQAAQRISELRILAIEARQVVMRLKYFEDPRTQLEAPSGPARERVRKAIRRFFMQSREFFGLPTGMSWVMYKLSFTARTPKEHLTEFISGLIQAAVLFGVNYTTLVTKAATDPSTTVFPILGATTAAAWKLLTGYVERANNAFFVQGIGFDPIRRFATNRAFFLLSAYMHSILISGTIQLAARGTEAMTPSILAYTAWNSFLGLFAKSLPLFFNL